jgi:hypothetical protein
MARAFVIRVALMKRTPTTHDRAVPGHMSAGHITFTARSPTVGRATPSVRGAFADSLSLTMNA